MLRFIIFCFVLVSIVGCATLPYVSSTSFRKGMPKNEIMSLFKFYNPAEMVKQPDGTEMWKYINIHDATARDSSRTVYSLYFEDDLLKAWKVETKEASDIDKLIAEERRKDLQKAIGKYPW